MKRALLATSFLAAFPLSLCLSAGTARAQPVSGVYLGAAGGWNFLQDERLRSFTGPAGTTPVTGGSVKFQSGAVGLGSVGYAFGNGVRVELEGDYRNNRLDVGTTRFPLLSEGGREVKYGAMANALFDMDIGLNWLYPYFGGGLGYQWVHLTDKASFAGGTEASLGGVQGSFAYQGIFGLSFPIAPVVGLSATVEYRYLGLTGDRTFTGYAAGPGGNARIAAKVTGDNSHNVLVGLRYAFNVAPPPPPPAPAPVAAPAPVPSRTYLVFFDWDRADLTARARQIVAEAAQASTRVQVTRIEVNGYTDLSGTAAYNQKLSVRRAQSVQAELIRDGVPANVISIHGYGESNPLVPTAQGVREPQNRRVEIILR